MAERLLLITPAWNEASHLERTARAIAAQSRRPDLWLIVDDGSDDGSAEILARLEGEIEFLKVLPGPRQDLEESDDRLAIAAEARAFNSALDTVDVDSYDFIGKLDADIELEPDYFERLLGHFEAEPGLGIAGGVLLEDDGNGWRLTKVPGYHVRGALKLYRRVTLERIGGIEERLGWDTIDETYARMYGYATRSFPDLVAAPTSSAIPPGGSPCARRRSPESGPSAFPAPPSSTATRARPSRRSAASKTTASSASCARSYVAV
jgi:poly-beta-1,6-N-acetyl-D-glucosamine synthase